MQTLVYQLRNLCRRSHEGSFATRQKREQVLLLVGKQLKEDLGYRHLRVETIKPKHVVALIGLWQSQGLSVGTIKTRMSHVRWWAEKVNRDRVVEPDNAAYNIANRQYLGRTSKAVETSETQLNAIRDEYVRVSVMLARAFGLRKEEAIKIIPTQADKGDHLWLKASWCKGKRERTVPILTEEQRTVLAEAKRIAGNGSLIPPHLMYHQQRSRYEAITRAVGLSKLHGLRHRYAQMRYHTLTGWHCPHLGGPSRRELSLEKRRLDIEARLKITAELGHSRIAVVATYIGA